MKTEALRSNVMSKKKIQQLNMIFSVKKIINIDFFVAWEKPTTDSIFKPRCDHSALVEYGAFNLYAITLHATGLNFA